MIYYSKKLGLFWYIQLKNQKSYYYAVTLMQGIGQVKFINRKNKSTTALIGPASEHFVLDYFKTCAGVLNLMHIASHVYI